MLSQELEQWWEELGQNCSKEFKTCLDSDVDELDFGCADCRNFCKNVIESFESWKAAKPSKKGADDVKDKADVDN